MTVNLILKPLNNSHTWSGVFISPLGKLILTGFDEVLTTLNINPPTPTTSSQPRNPVNTIPAAITVWLNNYFKQPKTNTTTIKVAPQGTKHQLKIWQAITRLAPGETLTYGELAKRCQSAPQAVGQALKKNPIAIVIPCHRIVAKNGLGGYSGQTAGEIVARKSQLLAHENITTFTAS